MMDAYSVIAKFYDSANTDFDYPKYFEFIKHYFSGKVVTLSNFSPSNVCTLKPAFFKQSRFAKGF